LLALTTRSLPRAREDWGRAMRAELEHVRGARARRRFSVGCARASALIRLRATFDAPRQGGAVVVAGLAAYGFFHYPELRADPSAWASTAALLALSLSYAVAGPVPKTGLVAGLVAGGAWYLVLSPPTALKAWVLVPLVIALLASACAAGAALWSGLVASVVWVTMAYVHDGRPYDAGLVRDFHHSGATDLATYAISGDLATGLELLVLIPVLAVGFGSLAALLPRAD
jgi:hypothetical protein